MNVLIVVFCVNLMPLMNDAHDINFATILKILKGKPRTIDYSIIEEPSQVDNNAITSKEQSQLFFENTAWPDDQFEVINVQDTRPYNTENKYSRKGLKKKQLTKNRINGNININTNRGSEEQEYDKTEEHNEISVDLMTDISNAIQNTRTTNQDRILKEFPRTTMVIFLLKPQEDNEPNPQNDTRRTTCDKNDSSDVSEYESSGSYERNPGNPFTIHKNKYKQNWPYNHFMDGDHMNINPLGPKFPSLGPSGPELFFGRKWWYFNQDDYKPIG